LAELGGEQPDGTAVKRGANKKQRSIRPSAWSARLFRSRAWILAEREEVDSSLSASSCIDFSTDNNALGAQTAYENMSQAISGIRIGSGLSGNLTLTLAVGNSALTVGTTSGLTVTSNGSGSVTLTGTTAALASLVYRGSHDIQRRGRVEPYPQR
jgi:hypothetical protein